MRNYSDTIEAKAVRARRQALRRGQAIDPLAERARLVAFWRKCAETNPAYRPHNGAWWHVFTWNPSFRRLLLPTLRKAERARIVNVSSRLAEKLTAFNFEDPQHERKYHGLSVYAQTKLANMLFSAELADRLRGTGIVSNALHPGDVVSDILREKPILRFFGRIAAPLFDTPQSASLTSIHVATAQTLSGTSGGYFKKQKAAKPSPLTADAAARQRLWKLSAELTGLPTDS